MMNARGAPCEPPLGDNEEVSEPVRKKSRTHGSQGPQEATKTGIKENKDFGRIISFKEDIMHERIL